VDMAISADEPEPFNLAEVDRELAAIGGAEG
jgi:hypothetical protein